MGGFTSPDSRLEYDFDTDAVLEIEIREGSGPREVDPNVFRSWTGPRWLNGEPYLGPRYNFLTNDPATSVVREATDAVPQHS